MTMRYRGSLNQGRDLTNSEAPPSRGGIPNIPNISKADIGDIRKAPPSRGDISKAPSHVHFGSDRAKDLKSVKRPKISIRKKIVIASLVAVTALASVHFGNAYMESATYKQNVEIDGAQKAILSAYDWRNTHSTTIEMNKLMYGVAAEDTKSRYASVTGRSSTGFTVTLHWDRMSWETMRKENIMYPYNLINFANGISKSSKDISTLDKRGVYVIDRVIRDKIEGDLALREEEVKALDKLESMRPGFISLFTQYGTRKTAEIILENAEAKKAQILRETEDKMHRDAGIKAVSDTFTTSSAPEVIGYTYVRNARIPEYRNITLPDKVGIMVHYAKGAEYFMDNDVVYNNSIYISPIMLRLNLGSGDTYVINHDRKEYNEVLGAQNNVMRAISVDSNRNLEKENIEHIATDARIEQERVGVNTLKKMLDKNNEKLSVNALKSLLKDIYAQEHKEIGNILSNQANKYSTLASLIRWHLS